MAQPTPYSRQYNFNDFATTSPSNPLPGVQVDNELNTVKTNLDGLNANIDLIQRDDGKLANQSVHKNSFDVDALALIGVSGYTVSGDWAASNAYAVGTLVNFNNATYLSTVAHTSGTVFATDQTAGKWILLANAAINTSGSAVDKFEGTGSQTAFTLSYTYSSTTDFLVFVNGALRNPNDDYSLSGTTLTLATPPSAPSVSGNENVIVWGANVATESSKQAAATSASNASGFATAASNAQTAAELALDTFDDRFLGAKSSNPSLDNDGNALLTGAIYWNTTNNVMLAYSGSAWISLKPSTSEQTNINTLAGISGLSTLATNSGNVTSAANIATEIGTVAGISTEIQTVAGDTVAISGASAQATKAQNYAIKVDGVIPTTSDASSKAHAIGDNGSVITNIIGSAKEWAIGGGTTPSATTHVDTGDEYSAKGYAIGAIDRGSNTGKHSAKDWATYTTGTVDGTLYSAKYYAQQAETNATTFSNVYQGTHSSDPSGGSVSAGDLYYNSSTQNLKFYNGTAWAAIEATDTSSFATKGFATAMSVAL